MKPYAFTFFSVFLMILLMVGSVSALSISGFVGYQKEVKGQDLKVVYEIINNNDLYIEQTFHLLVPENFSENTPILKIRIDPWEFMSTPPAKEFGVKVCEGWVYNKKFVDFDETCLQPFSYNVTKIPDERPLVNEGVGYEVAEYSDYVINIFDLNTSNEVPLSFSVKYVIADYIKRQGDSYFAHIKYENMDNGFKSIKNYFFFEDENAIIKQIPQDSKIKRMPFTKDGRPYYRWMVEFSGYEDQIIFFTDYAELQREQKEFEDRYFWRGFWIALLASIFLLALELMFEREIRDWLKPHKKKVKRWWKKGRRLLESLLI